MAVRILAWLASSPLCSADSPRSEAMLLEAVEDITSFAAFPLDHWK
jgi:hypothetical protein